jgi:hypothetical protein
MRGGWNQCACYTFCDVTSKSRMMELCETEAVNCQKPEIGLCVAADILKSIYSAIHCNISARGIE